MSKKFSRIFPDSWLDEHGVLSLDKMSTRKVMAEEAVAKIVDHPNVAFETRKTLFLVDVYGIFLRVTDWMRKNDIPVTTSDLPIRYAVELLMIAADGVRKRENGQLSIEGLDYDDLVNQIYTESHDESATITAVTRIQQGWELFFAPAPIEEIKHRAERASKQNIVWEKFLTDAKQGVVNTEHGRLDYRIYDDFTEGLAEFLGAKIAEKGFYRVHIDQHKGTVGLSEKEVDIRIAIRTMDFATSGEGAAICIVSSDQDYMPLHDRCKDSGISAYHSDVAKFDMHHNIGRRIKEMEHDHVLVSIEEEIHNGIIAEHLEPKGPLTLTSEQYSAIWQLQNLYK